MLGEAHDFLLCHGVCISAGAGRDLVKQTTKPFEVFVVQNGVISWPHVSISGHLVALLENQ